MIASRLMPRSPVWLRKIPSTVSGSQGSRRGLRPAVRFAFPLGARLNTTLRARPCQELFSESFSRPSRGPRGAPPSGLLPFAAASSVLYAPPARRGRETRPHTGCRQLQRGGARADGGDAGAWAASAGRFAPPRMRGRPGGPGVSARSRSIDATAPEVRRLRVSALRGDRLGCVYSTTYISRRIGLTFRPKVLPPSSRKRSFPYRWRFLIRLRQTSHEANTSRGCFLQPRAHRRVPSCSRP